MTFDAGRIRHDMSLMHYSRMSNGVAVPSNWRPAATGDTGVTWSPESATSVSYGSNSNDVSTSSAGGGSSLAARTDHTHRGVRSVAVASNTLVGDVTLLAQGSVGLTVNGQTIGINVAPTSGGGASVSYGSNSNQVSYANAPGASTLVSRTDHVHLGVTSLSHASNTFSGPVILTASGSLGITVPTPGTFNLSAVDTTGGSGGGGGSGLTIQYPGLKPSSPTDDFNQAALNGMWTAHSSQGSFALTDCKTQGEDWGGSALEMQFSAQMGAIWVSHSNTDLDFTVGGIRAKGPNTAAATTMFGIAALNSAGTGVGVCIYDDGNIYWSAISTWQYASNSDNWSQHGLRTVNSGGDWWLRMKRVSGTWTGYASQSGKAWDKTFSTRADSITVDRLVFGLLFQTAVAYSGRLTADYLQVDV